MGSGDDSTTEGGPNLGFSRGIGVRAHLVADIDVPRRREHAEKRLLAVFVDVSRGELLRLFRGRRLFGHGSRLVRVPDALSRSDEPPERASAPSSRRDRFRPRILDLGARFEVRDDSGFDRSPPYPKLDQTHHSARSKHFGASRRDRDDVLDTLRAASHPHAPRTVMGLREGRGPIANAIGIAAGITIGGVIVKASPPPPTNHPFHPLARQPPVAIRAGAHRSPPRLPPPSRG